MIQLNSSISNSDATNPQRVGQAVQVAVWVLICLIVIDLLINFIFAYPTDPKITNPARLRMYFEYGRSTEGQLRRLELCAEVGDGMKG